MASPGPSSNGDQRDTDDDLTVDEPDQVLQPTGNKSKGKHTAGSLLTLLPTFPFDNKHTRSLFQILFSQTQLSSLLAFNNPHILRIFDEVISAPIFQYFLDHHSDIFDESGESIPNVLNDDVCGKITEIHNEVDIDKDGLGSGYVLMRQEVGTIKASITEAIPQPRIQHLNDVADIYRTLESANETHCKVWDAVKKLRLAQPLCPPLTPKLFTQIPLHHLATFKGNATTDPARQMTSIFPTVLQAFYSHHRCDPRVTGPPTWKADGTIGEAAKLTTEQMARLATIYFGKAGTMKGAYNTPDRVASAYAPFINNLLSNDRERAFNRFHYNFVRLQADIRCLAIITIVPRALANEAIDLEPLIAMFAGDANPHRSTRILEALMRIVKGPSVSMDAIRRAASKRFKPCTTKARLSTTHLEYTAEHTLPHQWLDGPKDRLRNLEMEKLRGQAMYLTLALADLETSALETILAHEAFAIEAPILESYYINIHAQYRTIQGRINDVFRSWPMLEEDERLYHLATSRIAYTAHTMADLTTAHSSAEQMLCAAEMQRIMEELPMPGDFLEGVEDVTDSDDDQDMEEPEDEVVVPQPKIPFEDRSLGIHPFHVCPEYLHRFLGIQSKTQWIGLKDEVKPHRHQTTIATAILSSIWASESSDGSSALIADETGLGKTLAAAMIVSYLGWFSHATLQNMEDLPLVMHTDRKFLSAHHLFPSTTRAPCKAFPRPLATAPYHRPPIEGSPRPPGNPIIIIVPPVLITQWKQELEKALDNRRYQVTMAIKPLTPSDVKTIRGSISATEDGLGEHRPTHIILSTLSVLGMHSLIPFNVDDAKTETERERFETSLYQFNYDIVVFDEMHRYKGEKAEIHKLATKLSSLASVKLGMSATPCPNGFSELFSIMSVLCHPATRPGSDNDQNSIKNLAHHRFVQKETAKVTAFIKKEITLASMLDASNAGDTDSTATKAAKPQNLLEQSLAQWSKSSVSEDQMARLTTDSEKKAFKEAIEALNGAQDQYRRFTLRLFTGSLFMRTGMSVQPKANSLGKTGYYLVKSEDQLEQLLPTIPTEIVEIDVAVRRQTIAAITAQIEKTRPNLIDKPLSLAAIDAFYCKARQAETHPGGALLNGLCIPSEATEEPLAETTPKVKAIIKRIKEILEEDKDKPKSEQRKIMIYMRWTSLFRYLQAEFNAEGLSFASFTGSVSIGQDRATLVEQIQSDEDHPIIPPESVAHIRASLHDRQHLMDRIEPLLLSRIVCCSDVATDGLNLMRCSEVFFLDEVFSSSVGEQITGRTVRQGQVRTVRIYKFNNKASHDSTIRSLTINKVRGSMLIPPDWDARPPTVPPKSKTKAKNQRGRKGRETQGATESQGETSTISEARGTRDQGSALPDTETDSNSLDDNSSTAPSDAGDPAESEPAIPKARDPKPAASFLAPLSDDDVITMALNRFAPYSTDEIEVRIEWVERLQPIIRDIVHVLLRASNLIKVHTEKAQPIQPEDDVGSVRPIVQLQGPMSCFFWATVKDLPRDDPRFLEFVQAYTTLVNVTGAGKIRGVKRKAPDGTAASKKPRGKSGAAKGGTSIIDLDVMSINSDADIQMVSIWPMKSTPTAMWARLTPEVWNNPGARKRRQATYIRLLSWHQHKAQVVNEAFDPYMAKGQPFGKTLGDQDTITLRKLVENMKGKGDPYTYQTIDRIIESHPYPLCFHEALIPRKEDMVRMLDSEMTVCDPAWANGNNGLRDHRRWYSVVRYYLCHFLFGIQQDASDPPLRDDTLVDHSVEQRDWAIRVIFIHDAIANSATYRSAWNDSHKEAPKGFPSLYKPDRMMFAQFVTGLDMGQELPDLFGKDWHIGIKLPATDVSDQEPTDTTNALESFENYVQAFDSSDPYTEQPQE